MAGANTNKTGQSKLVNRHPIHVNIDEDEYRKFYRWCANNSTSPTAKVRDMILEHNRTHGDGVAHG